MVAPHQMHDSNREQKQTHKHSRHQRRNDSAHDPSSSTICRRLLSLMYSPGRRPLVCTLPHWLHLHDLLSCSSTRSTVQDSQPFDFAKAFTASHRRSRASIECLGIVCAWYALYASHISLSSGVTSTPSPPLSYALLLLPGFDSSRTFSSLELACFSGMRCIGLPTCC